MTATDSIFDATDPIALIRDWMAEAGRTEPNDPNAIALATVDADGMPNVRVVLLKDIEDGAFVFYTNYDSAKGREIEGAGKAAFVMHWKTLRRQVRVRGTVTREDGAAADAYYRLRPLGSRLGAWASRQSQPLADRATLEARLEEARAAQGDDPARPPFWGGYRIAPLSIELWQDGESRLHDRELWSRDGVDSPWSVKRLFP
ncbi:pyridoxamine 5'-phosphate oxidase [Palleronia sediminis]|uniref:Pyridoxine/pyridoxamine 5'-phosphate oxidase n=1 Tax=Palleronia sediminis TaxID=2547833 RepID=A0A4R6A9X6_9RHOB|nr:pyridoxamine 5'-phosphate oxidase [Palleronia sediminis]TDL78056.1 pyridoxamine 5'-phosphate oxidase [Palleronia sediminis]